MSDAISGRRRARARPDLGARGVELGEARVCEEARELVDASRHCSQLRERGERREVDAAAARAVALVRGVHGLLGVDLRLLDHALV